MSSRVASPPGRSLALVRGPDAPASPPVAFARPRRRRARRMIPPPRRPSRRPRRPILGVLLYRVVLQHAPHLALALALALDHDRASAAQPPRGQRRARRVRGRPPSRPRRPARHQARLALASGASATPRRSATSRWCLSARRKPATSAPSRACGAFECEDLRLVAPRADPYTRASLSAAKGAQHILRGAGVYDTLEDALLDAGKAVAFHVWIEGFDDDASSSRASESEASEESSSGTFRGRASALETVRDLDELMRRYPPERTNVRSAERRSARDEATEDPTDEDAFEWIANAERARVLSSSAGEARQLPAGDPTDDARATAEEGASSKNKTQTQTPGPWRVRTHRTPPANRSHRGAGKLALVFGREVEGLADREVRLCDAACAIPTGRVIESLSVSHAAVISLSRYFEESQRRRRRRATTMAGEGEEEERAEEGGGGSGRRVY